MKSTNRTHYYDCDLVHRTLDHQSEYFIKSSGNSLCYVHCKGTDVKVKIGGSKGGYTKKEGVSQLLRKNTQGRVSLLN